MLHLHLHLPLLLLLLLTERPLGSLQSTLCLERYLIGRESLAWH